MPTSPDSGDYRFNMPAIKPEVEVTFWRSLLMATPTTTNISSTPNIDLHCPHCPTTEIQDDSHQNRKWKYLLIGMSWRPDSNGHPYICDQARLANDTADIAWQWLITGVDDGGHHFRFRWPSSSILVVIQRRHNQVKIRKCHKHG